MSQQKLCYQFANDYLNNMARKYEMQTYGEKERAMAVDIETDMYNLCMLNLNEQELAEFDSVVIKKYNLISKQDRPTITFNEAILKVKKIKEVKDYLAKVETGQVSGNPKQEGQEWIIRVYEVVSYDNRAHLATHNWYYVNKNTGDITSEF